MDVAPNMRNVQGDSDTVTALPTDNSAQFIHAGSPLGNGGIVDCQCKLCTCIVCSSGVGWYPDALLGAAEAAMTNSLALCPHMKEI